MPQGRSHNLRHMWWVSHKEHSLPNQGDCLPCVLQTAPELDTVVLNVSRPPCCCWSIFLKHKPAFHGLSEPSRWSLPWAWHTSLPACLPPTLFSLISSLRYKLHAMKFTDVTRTVPWVLMKLFFHGTTTAIRIQDNFLMSLWFHPLLLPPVPGNYHSALWHGSFAFYKDFYMKGITEDVVFYVWLLFP